MLGRTEGASAKMTLAISTLSLALVFSLNLCTLFFFGSSLVLIVFPCVVECWDKANKQAGGQTDKTDRIAKKETKTGIRRLIGHSVASYSLIHTFPLFWFGFVVIQSALFSFSLLLLPPNRVPPPSTRAHSLLSLSRSCFALVPVLMMI